MSNVLKDMANVARYKLSSAAIRAKQMNIFLAQQLTQVTAPGGAQVPRVNMQLQSLLEREDVNLATSIRIITGSLAWLPLQVRSIDRDEKGNKVTEVDPDHPFNDLWIEPNTWNTTSEIKTHIGASLLTTGNSYVAMKTVPGRLLNATGVTSLWPVPPWTMMVKRNENGMPESYIQNRGTKLETKFTLDEVIHHRLYNINDPIYGRSGLEPLKRQIYTEYQAELMLMSFFVNDGTPRAVLSPDQSIRPEQAKAIETFYQNRANPDDKNRLQILPVAGKLERITPSQEDMEFQAMRKYHRERVFGLLGIPPSLAGDHEHAAFANLLLQEASFWRHTMIPFCSLIADFLTRQLLWIVYPDNKQHELAFDLSQVEALQMDQLKKAQKNRVLVGGGNSRGIMTANEIRQAEYGLEPADGGDELHVPKTGRQNAQADEAAAGSPSGAGADKVMKITTRSKDGEVIDIKSVDPDQYEAIWKAFDHLASEKEPIIQKALKTFWKGQMDRVITRLRAVTVEGLAMSNLFPHVRTKVGDLDDFMNLTLEDELMFKHFEPIILEIIGDIGDNEIGELRSVAPAGVAVSFDIDNPKVKGVIEQLTNRITKTNQKTFKDIRRILKTGFDQQLTVDEVARLITKKFKQYNLARSEMIARTEMTGIANAASNQAWSQNGATHKTWLATLDPVTRDYHVQYHGERVGINDVFKFGPEPLDYPGSAMATLPGNVIGCRCTLAYDFDPLTESEIQDLELQEVNA